MIVETPFLAKSWTPPATVAKTFKGRDPYKMACDFSAAILSVAQPLEHKIIRHQCGTVFYVIRDGLAYEFIPG